jgi:hypothetical protein
MNVKLEKLKNMVGRKLPSGKTEYVIEYCDENYLVFEPTGKSKRVMFPSELVLEWITALEYGLITRSSEPDKMKEVVMPASNWANYHHGFRTHLAAVVRNWSI